MAVVGTVTGSGGIDLAGTAAVGFSPGGGQVDAGVVVEWDLDGDGDFDTDEERITGYVMSGEAGGGRDFPSQLSGRAGPGHYRLTLDNSDDRFSYFNADSPLNQEGRSLRVGRTIRVRTAESIPLDPVLLARDRFGRPDGPLGAAETGQVWPAPAAAGVTVVDGQATATAMSAGLVTGAVLDTGGGPVLYAQVQLGAIYGSNRAGLVIRRADANNRLTALLGAGGTGLALIETVGGVDTVLGTWSGTVTAFWPWAGITLGLGTSGDGTTVTAYLSGVPLITGTHDVAGGDGIAGLAYEWDEQSAPTWGGFHVWDDIARPWEGALWTGQVTGVEVDAPVGGPKTATVDADGRLANAALPSVSAPLPVFGAPTGLLVGDVLAKAGMLDPPGTIAMGDVSTGAVDVEDGDALTLARHFEETELGLIVEAPEGPIGFQSRTHRSASVAPVAWLTDAADGPHGYSSIRPLDQRRDIVNRVTAGIAPAAPTVAATTTRQASTGVGVTNHVDVLMPTVTAGRLLVVVIASTVGTSGVGWHVPIWWQAQRTFSGDDDDSIRTRVYTRIADGTESGTTVRFYTDGGNSGGAWIARIMQVTNWFGATQGIAASEWVPGSTPSPLAHGWGRTPSLFVAINAGLTSVNGGTVDPDTLAWPDGYSEQSPTSINGSVNGSDVALHIVDLTAVAEGDAPTSFGGLTGYAIQESGLLAIRGFDGPHLALPTLANPNQFQESPGRVVTVDDLASQDDLRVVRSRPQPAALFRNEDDAQAYAVTILTTWSVDRPVVAVTFPATTSASMRALAIRRRVGDRIHLTATGRSGMGIDGGYWIEHVSHTITNGGKQWWVTWELAPA